MFNAFKNNVTVLSEANLNPLLSHHDFVNIYEGTQRDAKTGAGTEERDIAGYNHAIRFTATGTTEVARVEFELVKHGTGADLTLEIRDNTFNPDGSNDGVLKKSVVLPKEFIPGAKAYFSIAVALTGLTSGAYYWLIVKKEGDATNHFHIHGETATDANYPCYRRAGTSGAWTEINATHFKVFSGESGNMLHIIMGGTAFATVEYSADQPNKEYLYVPPSDGAAGGVRQIITLTWSGEYLKQGVVS